MKNRQQYLYEKVLNKFHEIYENELAYVETIEVKTDEEPAQFNAWCKVFGKHGLGKDLTVTNCFFHYNKNLTENFKKVDKTFFRFEGADRKKNYKFYLWLKYLPFMPTTTIEYLSEHFFKEKIPDCLKGIFEAYAKKIKKSGYTERLSAYDYVRARIDNEGNPTSSLDATTSGQEGLHSS